MKTTKLNISKIQELRSRGYSVPEISNELNIPKTTVFKYVRDIKILPEYKDAWLGKRGGSKKKKLKLIKEATDEAIKFILNPTQRDKILFLSALYWAEGNKKDFILSNTDPNLIKVFITALRQVFKVDDERLRISIRIYEDMDKEECLDFWSNIVKIPKEKFLNVNILYGKKQGKLKYGMCRVRVAKGGDLLKKVNAINKIFATSIASNP